MNNTYVMGATKITLSALGASVFPTSISPPSGCVAMDLQYLSGGSAMIIPNALASKTMSGATTPIGIEGFMLPAAVPLQINGPAYFYMASGSTNTASVIGINFHYSSGGATLT